MSIILNEYDWAERAIRDKDLGKKPVETLSRISKYYYANRYSKSEIRSLLDMFILQCDPSASLVKWAGILDRVAKSADKYALIRVDGVKISDTELQRIMELEGVQVRRLAFTLLCVSKYWDMASEKNNHWVNTSDKDIMKMANIRTSVKRQGAMFANLRDHGLIRFSKKIDNLNVQVLFSDDGSEEMFIRDFRNLGYQYMNHYETGYFECQNCGIIDKEKKRSSAAGRKQKYCPECAAEIRTKQNIESVMRHRAMLKS